MVKDEEKNIERCIRSIQALGAIDEILIVDTGSTDETPKIAATLGATVRILENPDEYFVETDEGKFLNFGKARNESFRDASGDWLLLMDADETVQGDATNLKTELNRLPNDIEGVSLKFADVQKNIEVMHFLSPRIFRNGRVHFEEIVHNRPVFKPPSYHVPEIKLTIKHYGYDLTPEHEEKKRTRTIALLKHRLKQNPDDFGAYFYLSQMFANHGDSESAIDYAIRYIGKKDKLEVFNPSIYFTLIMECKKAKNYKLMDKWLAVALRELPNDIDIAAATITYGEKTKKPLVIKRGAENFIRNYDMLKADPVANGARFIYNYNDFSLTRALFHAGLMNIHEGINKLRRMFSVLEGMTGEEKFVTTVIGDAARELDNMKFKNWRKVIANPNESKKVINIKNHKKKSNRKRKGKNKNVRRR